ncbi:MAG: cyclic pyranopterin monophosphate synthase MoaC [Planctomycetota bacterium]
MNHDLSHLDDTGDPQMVDVGEKPLARRVATASGLVRASTALVDAIKQDRVAKGSVLQVARLAGIQAAKRTDSLIPLCHSLPIDAVKVELDLLEDGIAIRTEVSTTWKTGVEMEALTAASVAALTVIDMGKAIDPAMTIERIQLETKTGGRRGAWTRQEHPSGRPE